MATNYIAPTWRMPENSNQSKLSNYSIDFDGTSDYIDLGSDVLFDSTKGFSFSAWVYLDGYTASFPAIVKLITDKSATSNTCWSMGLSNVAGYTGVFFGSSSDFAKCTTDGDISGDFIEAWKHVCVTFDGVDRGALSSYKIYVNGVNITLVAAGAFGATSTASSTIGWAISTNYWNGKLSQVCIFDYELSTDQITYLYNLNNPMAITGGGKPIAYYPLGDDSNPTALAGYPNISVGDTVFDFPVRSNPATQNMSVANSGITAFNNATNFSCSGWFYIDGNLSQSILNINDGANNRFAINYYAPLQGLRGNVNIGDSGVYSSARNVAGLVTGRWFHYCAVFDGAGATNADKILLYIDGQAKTLTFPAGTYASSMGTIGATNELEIGKSLSGTFLGFGGDVTNVQMWNVSLSPTEVTTLYNNGTPYTGTQPQASNLQIWYKLNGDTDTFDGTNWTLKDDGLIGADMTSSGMTSANLVQSDLYRQTPYSNYSIKFDGTDYFADTGGGFFDSATSVSISCWMKMEDISAGRPVISNWGTSASDRQYLIRWADNTGNGFQFYFYGPNGATSGSFVLAESASTVTAVTDRWYNVVGTWDGSNIRIYVDGVERGSEASSGSVQSVTSANWIGRYSTTYMDGNLSNIALWKNTALTQAQITEIYNAGIPTDLSSFSGTAPTHWYTLDGKKVYYNGSVLVARDAIGTSDTTGVNLVQENIEGNAPGSNSNGTGVSLDITDLKGDMSNSNNNAHSINMADYGDPNAQGVTPADSGRTTSVPG